MNILKLALLLLFAAAPAHGMLAPLARVGTKAQANQALTALVRHMSSQTPDDKPQETTLASTQEKLLKHERILQRQSLTNELCELRRMREKSLMLTTVFSGFTAFGLTDPGIPGAFPVITGLIASGLACCYHFDRQSILDCLKELEEFDKTTSNK